MDHRATPSVTRADGDGTGSRILLTRTEKHP
jgi:hypothetical protein